ncbi:RICIN domain-containing protein [Streptacidiphilus anmyonensis]|uniref:RICIN domain-containing protein n=1 Tax=Streptacidiphilus anmyonensis TaxID=405782 RepID=UPI00069363E5|nr:RICIN domain-containing protein [Streptacidiphilus anmyonensis]
MRTALRRLSSTGATIALAAGLGLAGTGTAHADTPAYWNFKAGATYVLQNQSGPWDCLDDSNDGANGSDLMRGYTCNYGTYQMWNVIQYNGGWVQLRNVGTGRCLDYSNQFGLRGYPCKGYGSWSTDGYQSWEMKTRVLSLQNNVLQDVVQNANLNPLDGYNQCLTDFWTGIGMDGGDCSGGLQDSGEQGWTITQKS